MHHAIPDKWLHGNQDFTGETKLESTISASGDTAKTSNTFEVQSRVSVSHGTSNFSISISLPTQWNDKSAKRYQALVRKEALDSITPEELKELEVLQSVRQLNENPPPPEEIERRLRVEKKDLELLEALSKYVSYTPFPKNPKSRNAS